MGLDHRSTAVSLHADPVRAMWRCSSSAFLAGAVRRIDSPDEPDDAAFTRVLTELHDYQEHLRAVVARGSDLIITVH